MKNKNISVSSGDSVVIKSDNSPLSKELSSLFPSKTMDYDSQDHKPGSRVEKKKKEDRSWEKVSGSSKTKENQVSEEVKQIISKGKKSSEDWTKMLLSSTPSNDKMKGQILPSRSGNENNYGGRSALVGPQKTTIFDPDSINRAKNDPLTDIMLKDSKLKKKEREDRKARSRDWEKPSISQTSNDFKPAQMGYTPNRSGYTPAESKKVVVPEIEAIKRQSKLNEKNAAEAVTIKKLINNAFVSDLDRSAKDNRSWEKRKADDIESVQKKEFSYKEQKIKVAPDFVPTKQAKSDDMKDKLQDIFAPKKEQKDLDLKRKSDIHTPRKKREDDRSWEKISGQKTTRI